MRTYIIKYNNNISIQLMYWSLKIYSNILDKFKFLWYLKQIQKHKQTAEVNIINNNNSKMINYTDNNMGPRGLKVNLTLRECHIDEYT